MQPSQSSEYERVSLSLHLKVHPIFVISVADCVLGFSWVLGGAFWFGQVEDRSWCFLPSILTVVHCHSPPSPSSTLMLSLSHYQIMQCVSVNLTVVYALIAYGLIKRQDFSSVLVRPAIHSVWLVANSPCPLNS